MLRKTVTVLATVVCCATGLSAQQLPEYTPAQRWQRAEYLLNGWIVFSVRHGKMMGQSVEQIADALVEVFGPAWPRDMGPLDMMQAMHSNWMWQSNARFEVLEASPDLVRFRANRTWIPDFFGDDQEAFGVTVREHEALLERFQRTICAQRGMALDWSAEGDWVHVTIRRQ